MQDSDVRTFVAAHGLEKMCMWYDFCSDLYRVSRNRCSACAGSAKDHMQDLALVNFETHTTT
jgi:hypothetical protein